MAGLTFISNIIPEIRALCGSYLPKGSLLQKTSDLKSFTNSNCLTMRVVKTSYPEHEAARIPIAIADNKPAYLAAEEVRKIALPTMEGIQFEPVRNIISLEANGNYTYLYFTDGRQLLVCKTLRELEEMLHNPIQFVRIHRSYTINLNKILKYVRGKGGYVVMEDGSYRNVSNGKKESFFGALRRYFG